MRISEECGAMMGPTTGFHDAETGRTMNRARGTTKTDLRSRMKMKDLYAILGIEDDDDISDEDFSGHEDSEDDEENVSSSDPAPDDKNKDVCKECEMTKEVEKKDLQMYTWSHTSKGPRNRKSRFCKCQPQLTAIVSRVSGDQYEIMIRNQNHTHSHPTSDTQASTYLTTKTLPLDNQDREDVKTLADARVSSTVITNFLNDRIGCKVMPQQTRSLIRSIMSQGSGKDRLKDMLHALRQLEGSDILVIEDQMDVTCGIVMQTKVQKIMFEQWGETLTMNFTHGTNNVGYHMGAYD